MKIPIFLKKVRNIKITANDLIDFENEIKIKYEEAKIKAPIHLSKGNEKQLIKIFQYINSKDWVFSSWRNHYHALLHGISKKKLFNDILEGKSMSTSSKSPKFYSSSIVGGTIPIALGVAKALKKKKSKLKAWCFIGDMTFETGIFYEAHKYASNHDLPLQFVVEDNNISTNTPTNYTWGNKKRKIPKNIIYYKYNLDYPHHGTGKWVPF